MNTVHKIASNAWGQLLARIFIVAGLPIIVFLATRVVASMDKQLDKIDSLTGLLYEMKADNSVLKQTFDSQKANRDNQISDIKGQLLDHEGRLRTLEKFKVN